MRILFLFLFLPTLSFSQKLKLVNATAQRWSGGIAGSSGTNYSVEFSVSPKDSVHLDSVYLNGKSYGLVASNQAIYDAFWFKRPEKKKTFISLIIKESFMQCAYPVADPMQQVKAPMPAVAEGSALLIYHVNGKKKQLLIKSFTALPPVNYP
ncbi:MAG: hypothetical protein ACKOXB_13040 [Flavobacteriales bacterium]